MRKGVSHPLAGKGWLKREGALVERFDDGEELLYAERSATDETTVDVGLREEFLSVSSVAATTVEDRAVFSDLSTVLLSDEATDVSVDLLSLSGGSGEARTDSPDGFVSEDDLTEVFSREREYGFFELLLYDFEVLASFALFLDFADAEDRSKAFSKSQTYLIREDSTIFVVVSTTLRVAEDDVACTRRSDLCSRDFTRVSTFSLVSAVLSSDSYGAAFSFLSDRCEVDEGGTDDDVTVEGLASEGSLEFADEGDPFAEGLVHLPVTGDDILSHCYFDKEDYLVKCKRFLMCRWTVRWSFLAQKRRKAKSSSAAHAQRR